MEKTNRASKLLTISKIFRGFLITHKRDQNLTLVTKVKHFRIIYESQRIELYIFSKSILKLRHFLLGILCLPPQRP